MVLLLKGKYIKFLGSTKLISKVHSASIYILKPRCRILQPKVRCWLISIPRYLFPWSASFPLAIICTLLLIRKIRFSSPSSLRVGVNICLLSGWNLTTLYTNYVINISLTSCFTMGRTISVEVLPTDTCSRVIVS